MIQPMCICVYVYVYVFIYIYIYFFYDALYAIYLYYIMWACLSYNYGPQNLGAKNGVPRFKDNFIMTSCDVSPYMICLTGKSQLIAGKCWLVNLYNSPILGIHAYLLWRDAFSGAFFSRAGGPSFHVGDASKWSLFQGCKTFRYGKSMYYQHCENEEKG